MNPEEVIRRLEEWPEDELELIGIAESRELEFKATYHLQTPKQRVEFAKDIAGMANSGGGLIVVGIETRPDERLGRDVSVRIRPLATGIANLSQMEDIARSWIYPPQREIRFREWPDGSGRMLLSIRVPTIPEGQGVCLVLGPGEEPDRRTIGVPIRSESRVDFHLAAEIYEWIRRGRLEKAPGAPPLTSAGPWEEADAALERGRMELEIDREGGDAVYFLQAWPESATRLERLFDRDGVMGLFVDPPDHRTIGFHWWGLRPEADSEGGLRLPAGDGLFFTVTPTGVSTLGVAQPYLAWGMNKYKGLDEGPLINPTALGEYTYEFCRTHLLISRFCNPLPTRLIFRFALLNGLLPQPARLGSGLPSTGVGFRFNAKAAPKNELIDTMPKDAGDLGQDRAGVIAAQILRRFYERFGLGRDAIPHLSDAGDQYDPSTLE